MVSEIVGGNGWRKSGLLLEFMEAQRSYRRAICIQDEGNRRADVEVLKAELDSLLAWGGKVGDDRLPVVPTDLPADFRIGDDNPVPVLPVRRRRGLQGNLQTLPDQTHRHAARQVETLANRAGGGQQLIRAQRQRGHAAMMSTNPAPPTVTPDRSEERRVGKECRSRWS